MVCIAGIVGALEELETTGHIYILCISCARLPENPLIATQRHVPLINDALRIRMSVMFSGSPAVVMSA